MSGIILHTSGSTDEPKKIFHSWESINNFASKTIDEINLTYEDRVLDVFPANTIAHYTITAYPALLSKAQLHTAVFNPYEYIELFKSIRPTFISLIPKHLDLLKATKGFSRLDMSCVRYMVTGSNKIEQEFIDTFRDCGVQLVANWYGMTEFPPPIMIGYNSTIFTKIDDSISFTKNQECLVNGQPTGDIFNLDTMEFSHRIKLDNGKTWKTNV